MSIQCPHCQGSQCVSIPAAFAQGTTAWNQTVLATIASPPRRRPLWNPIMWGITCLVILPFAIRILQNETTRSYIPSDIVFVAILAFGACMSIIMFSRRLRWNRVTWPQLYAAWQERWICVQCATVFLPGEGLHSTARKATLGD